MSEQKLEHVYSWEIQKMSFNGNFDTNENMLFASEEGKCFLVFSSSAVKSAVKWPLSDKVNTKSCQTSSHLEGKRWERLFVIITSSNKKGF